MKVLFLLLLISTATYAEVRDTPTIIKDINLLDEMTFNPNFFHTTAKFSPSGVAKNKETGQVYGVEVLSVNPPKIPFENIRYIFDTCLYIRAIINEDSSHKFVRYLWLLSYKSNPKRYITEVDKDIPIRDMDLKVKISLTDRLAQVTSGTEIIATYPLGVGALNEGMNKDAVRSLTPTLEGYLDSKDLWPARCFPEYFKCRPFVRITSNERGYEPLGLHILQGNTSVLTRGYMSHGCIRMREKDLYEIKLLVEERKRVGLSITYDRIIYSHSVTKVDDWYYRTKNFGTKAKPEFRRSEKDGLVILERVKKSFPKNFVGGL